MSGGGYDTIFGGGGTDTVSYANETASVIVNLKNGRTTYSRFASDNFASRDTLDSIENAIGSNFNDTLNGSNGDNQLEGGAGNDLLSAANGDDILYGGRGNDRLIGFDGSDILIGGADADTFVLHGFSGTEDIIRDFNPGEGDIIEVVRHGSVTNLTELYADEGIKIIQVTNDTDHTGNGALDTVFRFDLGATGADDADYLLILEGFTDPILFEYFNPVGD